MPIYYPQGLPLGLHSGRSYQLVNPLMRSDLDSGRARQRRRFRDVPEGAQIAWLFSGIQARTFIAWFRDALTDGVEWFECPLNHPSLGLTYYTCRFTGVYKGPSRVGPDLWSITAELELRDRAAIADGWGLFPEFILEADLIDLALNREWPLNEWQIYMEAADFAANRDWPTP